MNHFIFQNQRGSGLTYTVKEGDSLYKIANQFGTTVASLMMVNQLHNTLLTVGQVLVIQEPESIPPPDTYDNYASFLEDHKGVGTLKVHVYTAGGLYPLKGAKVRVSKKFKDQRKIFFEGETEESGIIDSIVLPAFLIHDDYPQSTPYEVEAFHEKYTQMNVQKTYIYNGIKSIQGIEMMPSTMSKEVMRDGR